MAYISAIKLSNSGEAEWKVRYMWQKSNPAEFQRLKIDFPEFLNWWKIDITDKRNEKQSFFEKLLISGSTFLKKYWYRNFRPAQSLRFSKATDTLSFKQADVL